MEIILETNKESTGKLLDHSKTYEHFKAILQNMVCIQWVILSSSGGHSKIHLTNT